jgi:hypothetical protein
MPTARSSTSAQTARSSSLNRSVFAPRAIVARALESGELKQWAFDIAISNTHKDLGLGDEFPLDAGTRVLLLIEEYHR